MYQCLALDFDTRVEKKIQSIIRQINKYGFSADYKVISREVKELPVYRIDYATQTKTDLHQKALAEVVNYEFNMPDFKVGDYTPVAVIEHNVVEGVADVTNMVHLINNFEDAPKSWWNIDGHCDDCNDKYSRKKTVMLLNNTDGTFRQIGTSCLKRYLGITCFNVINNYMSVEELVEEEVYIDYNFLPHENRYVETERYLGCVLDAYKEFGGYIRDKVVEKAFDNARDISYVVSDESKENARVIIDFFRSADTSDSKIFNDFMMNIRAAALTKYIGRSGYIAYVPQAYEKINNLIESKNNDLSSEYIGNVGEKINIEVVVTKCVGFETQWGYSYMNIFKQCDTNNVLVWTTSTKAYEVGIKLNISATVKAHREYNEVKQTVLTRVKEV